MSPERCNIPDWARQERQVDLAWVRENLDVFWISSWLAFEDIGRGALAIDTTVQIPEGGNPFGYLSQEIIENEGDEDTKRKVREYDPHNEFVIVLLKLEEKSSTYRVSLQKRLS